MKAAAPPRQLLRPHATPDAAVRRRAAPDRLATASFAPVTSVMAVVNRHSSRSPPLMAEYRQLFALLRELGCTAPVTVEAFDAARLAEVGAVQFAREVADATRAEIASSVGLAAGLFA